MNKSRVSGVILAAGEGKRMGKLGQLFPKACLPLLNKPLLSYNLSMLSNMGIQETIIVFNRENRDVVKSIAAAYAPPGMNILFIEQPEQHGIADALQHARHITGDYIVLVLGDTFFVPHDLNSSLSILLSGNHDGLAGVLSIRSVSDPSLICKECSVKLDSQGYLLEIKEKPEVPWNNIKPCGVYFFSRSIFRAIEQTLPSALRHEVEITDTINTLLTLGYKVKCEETIVRDYNLSSKEDLLNSNLAELKQLNKSILIGDNTYIHPMAVIDESVIGNEVKIKACVNISRSIVLDGTHLEESASYENCIIGNDFVLPCNPKI